MAVNPYTLNHLYQNGILDYVPTDLCSGVNVSALTPAMNPYMQNAMQGELYQNYTVGDDKYTPSVNLNNPENQSQAGWNASGMPGVGSYSRAGWNAWGMPGVGVNSRAGVNSFGMPDVGSSSNAHLNALGINDFGENNSSDSTKRSSGIIPTMALGLLSVGILGGTLMYCLRKGKNASVNFGNKLLDKLKFWKK